MMVPLLEARVLVRMPVKTCIPIIQRREQFQLVRKTGPALQTPSGEKIGTHKFSPMASVLTVGGE